jgi:outer membrane protein OmpA-like peptidoglycan-associated protein
MMNTRLNVVGLVLGLVGAVACNSSDNEHRAVAQTTAAPMRHEPMMPPAPARAMPAVALVTADPHCQMRRVFFATDSAALTEESRGDLTAYAHCLSSATHEDVVLRGRADPRGTESYNQTLSEQRAEAVATFLQTQGVAADRIQVQALGESGDVEGMPQLWPQQRRVTIRPADSGGMATTPTGGNSQGMGGRKS